MLIGTRFSKTSARCARAVWIAGCLLAAVLAAPALGQDSETLLEGREILDHPGGSSILEAAKRIWAGDLDTVKRASTREFREHWASASASDRRDAARSAQSQAPEPESFEQEIARAGEMVVRSDFVGLRVPSEDGLIEIVAFASLEDDVWRVTAGPTIIDIAPPESGEPPLVGAEILQHEIGGLVLAFARALEAGDFEGSMELATAEAQAERREVSAEERDESDRFWKKMLPGAAELEEQIGSSGQLQLEQDRAHLNLISVTQTTNADGSVTSSSTTLSIPFQLEDGRWRIRR
jgi:hypothetical protein